VGEAAQRIETEAMEYMGWALLTKMELAYCSMGLDRTISTKINILLTYKAMRL
jgi:hypothetical protein